MAPLALPVYNNIARIWGQQCDPLTRPGVILETDTGWRDGKTGYTYGPGKWCVSYDGAVPPAVGGQPPILPPSNTTGGVGSTPAPVHVGCGCLGETPTSATPPAPGGAGTATASPAVPVPVVKVLDRLMGLPWWVYVLALLAASQLFNRGQVRG